MTKINSNPSKDDKLKTVVGNHLAQDSHVIETIKANVEKNSSYFCDNFTDESFYLLIQLLFESKNDLSSCFQNQESEIYFFT